VLSRGHQYFVLNPGGLRNLLKLRVNPLLYERWRASDKNYLEENHHANNSKNMAGDQSLPYFYEDILEK